MVLTLKVLELLIKCGFDCKSADLKLCITKERQPRASERLVHQPIFFRQRNVYKFMRIKMYYELIHSKCWFWLNGIKRSISVQLFPRFIVNKMFKD